jgi:hypothetical protein
MLLLCQFLLLFFVMSFHYHVGEFTASDCPICKAKSSIQSALHEDINLDAFKTALFQVAAEQPFIHIPILLQSASLRAPPQPSEC